MGNDRVQLMAGGRHRPRQKKSPGKAGDPGCVHVVSFPKLGWPCRVRTKTGPYQDGNTGTMGGTQAFISTLDNDMHRPGEHGCSIWFLWDELLYEVGSSGQPPRGVFNCGKSCHITLICFLILVLCALLTGIIAPLMTTMSSWISSTCDRLTI
jgi:hypothetical protein